MFPYFYIIQHISTGIYYAGCKINKNADSNNLMTEHGYQTTSKVVKNIIKNEGLSSFKIRKIKKFKSPDETLKYENKFLLKVNAANNPNFYNKQNGGKNFVNRGGYRLKESTKNKMRKPKSLETKEKIKNAISNRSQETYKKAVETRKSKNVPWISDSQKMKIIEHNTNYWSDDVRDNHRKIMIEYYTHNPISNETRKILSERNKGENNNMYGKKHTEETRLKMKKAWEKRKLNNL